MSPRRPDKPPGHSLSRRNALRVAFAVPTVAAVIAMIIQNNEHINVEAAGLREGYFFAIAAAVCLAGIAGILAVWRCPACGAWLGRAVSPRTCAGCGARFK
jgi:hypothetical protein